MSYKALSVKQMREAEKTAIDDYGFSEDILIENAAFCVYENIAMKITRRDKIAIVCGGGLNGCDGMSLARKLFLSDYNVIVYFIPGGEKLEQNARLTALKKLKVPLVEVLEIGQLDFKNCALIIDGILGIGLNRNLEGLMLEAVEKINAAKIYTVSIDIPSGLSADTGLVMGAAAEANETITFSALKLGQILNEGRNYCGNIIVANIGIPVDCDEYISIVEESDCNLPNRKTVSHKGSYGVVKIIAGSPTMIGASLLSYESAVAALKSGAGLVTLAVPESMKQVYQSRVKENTLMFLDDKDGMICFNKEQTDKLMTKADTIVIGMGLGDNAEVIKIIKYLAENFSGVLVIDADGLNAISKDMSAIKGHKCKLILTPHVGEFKRLTEGNIHTVYKTDYELAKALAQEFDAVVVVKSATSIISDGKNVFLNTTGTPAMAKGGSGDVLAGMIGAFGCRLSPLQAVKTACYHFGKIGEVAESVYGSESVLASNLIIK